MMFSGVSGIGSGIGCFTGLPRRRFLVVIGCSLWLRCEVLILSAIDRAPLYPPLSGTGLPPLIVTSERE